MAEPLGAKERTAMADRIQDALYELRKLVAPEKAGRADELMAGIIDDLYILDLKRSDKEKRRRSTLATLRNMKSLGE